VPNKIASVPSWRSVPSKARKELVVAVAKYQILGCNTGISYSISKYWKDVKPGKLIILKNRFLCSSYFPANIE
jgi:hypothetical protein